MTVLSILFAAIALITGLVAAWYWYASTRQKIDPAIYTTDDGREAFRPKEWNKNVTKVVAEASRLNGRAAIWTAVAVISSALSTMFSALGAN